MPSRALINPLTVLGLRIGYAAQPSPDGLARFCHALFNLSEFVYRQ